MPDKLEKKYLKQGIKELAEELAGALKSAAPRAAFHKPFRGGVSVPEHLADSFGIKASVRKGGARALVKGNFYGKFLEFGTRFMSARPFVRPVMDGVGQSALQQFLDKLAQLIQNNPK